MSAIEILLFHAYGSLLGDRVFGITDLESIMQSTTGIGRPGTIAGR
jgi:hypothetical protein